jgi:hypothetical protein
MANNDFLGMRRFASLAFVLALTSAECHAGDVPGLRTGNYRNNPEISASSRAIAKCIEAIKGRDSDARADAYFALAKLGRDARPAIPLLVEALRDPDVHVRWSAAIAVGEMARSVTDLWPTWKVRLRARISGFEGAFMPSLPGRLLDVSGR